MEYRLLGPVEVEREGRVLPLGGPKQRAVLAILLLRRGTSVPSDVLIDELWGESPPPTARNALQGYVFQLRKVLEPGVRRGEPHRILASDGAGYRIDLDTDELDVDRFERLTAEGRRLLEASPAAAAARLEEALALWRGPPLADLAFEPFAQEATLRLEEERLAAQELLVEARLDAGGGPELVGELEALVARQPLRERLREHLVLALYRAGRQADALEAFAAARSALVDGLGIEPGDRLRELHRAVLNQDPGLLPAAPEPPLSSRPPPRPPTPLVGREIELHELERLLDAQRLVTLVGPGGVGKTRLALELAGRASDRFPGGVLWLTLDTARDPQTVTDELAAAVGGDPAAQLDGRRVLVVLDNLEQVLGCASALADLVAATEGPVVLATSRAPLDIAAERRFPVSVLDPHAAAVLFCQRADALGSPVDDDTVVRHICDRLDGLPLAVELAAARVPAMAPAELLQRLDDRLRMLEGSRRDAPERQRTLRGAIAWSHDLLDDDERQGFAALGVFSGGWTQEAAVVVCGTEPAVLASLVEKSLVRRDGARFAMLETVRDFASERLREQPGHEHLAAAHAAYYCSLVRRLDTERPDGWIRELESDYANVRAALDGALTGGDVDLALETLASLHVFWDAHGYSAEGLRRLEAALASDGGSNGARARGLYAAGILYAHQRRFADAERLHRLSADVARAHGDDPALSRALNGLAVALYHQERHHEAESVLREALKLKERLRDDRGAAIIRGSLGNALRAAGRLAEAETEYEAAVAGFVQVGDRLGEAVALDNLGSTRIVACDPTGAIPLLRRAVALADELDALSVLASAGAHLGCALLGSDREEASVLLNRSVELFQQLDEPDGVADALDGLAGWALPEDPDRATDLLRSADALRAECGSAPGAVERLLRERIAGTVAGGASVD